MSLIQFKNNATTTLASGINNSTTSLTVAAGTGVKFPALTGNQYFYCTLTDIATKLVIEIIKVTARSTDTFTIVRGQEGTTGTAFLTGDIVELRLTKQGIRDVIIQEDYSTPAISAGTLTLDLSTSSVFDVALNANITTLTISNPAAAGTSHSFTLNLTANGTPYTIAYGGSVTFLSGVAPTIDSTNGRVTKLVFNTTNGGTNWLISDGAGVSVSTVQDGSFVWCGTAGGTANALTLSPTPAITAYKAGRTFMFKSGASANTAATTIQISGLVTPRAIQKQGAALTGGEIAANSWYEVLDDGTNFQLVAAEKGNVSIPAIQNQSYTWCGTAGGTANAITLTPTPAITAYADGQVFEFYYATGPNTGNTTIAVSGLAAQTAQASNFTNMRGGELESGQSYRCTFISSKFLVEKIGAKTTFQQAVNLAKSATTITAASFIDPFGITDGNLIHVTGSTQINGITSAPQAGMVRTLIFDSKVLFTTVKGVRTYQMCPGDMVTIIADTVSTFRCLSHNAATYMTTEGITATFNMATASSTNTYLSFQYAFADAAMPRGMILLASTTSGSNCNVVGILIANGYSETFTMLFQNINGGGTQSSYGNATFTAYIDASNYQTFAVSYDQANQRMLLVNTKTGSPTGTLNISINAWR